MREIIVWRCQHWESINNMWGWIQEAIKVLSGLFSGSKEAVQGPAPDGKRLPDVFFSELTVTDKTPSNSAIAPKQFVDVVYNGVPRWAIFKCPCTCGETISLPLQAPHSPRWRVTPSKAGRPDLYPSVWRNKGCMSHFWIEDGRVFWCNDSGIAPSKARPDIYRPRK